MIKAYHGTSEQKAQKILASGVFNQGTYFAFDIHESQEYGPVVFECLFKPEGFRNEGPDTWQFHLREDMSLEELKAKKVTSPEGVESVG